MGVLEKRDTTATLVARATTTKTSTTSTTSKTSKATSATASTKVSSTSSGLTTSSQTTSTASSTTQTSSTSTSQTSPPSATATAVRGSTGSGLSTGGVVAIILGIIALVLLVALIVVFLQKRSAKKRLRGEHRAPKEGFYPLQSDPVCAPAATYSWQGSVTPGLAESFHDASSIQNSPAYGNSPMIGPATMVPVPAGLRPGVRNDSGAFDLEIPGFEMQSQTPSVAYPGHTTGYAGHVHELESTSAAADTASSPPPRPVTNWADDGDKIFVSQSSPNESTSQIQEIESAKTRLQERRQRLLELSQVDEEEARLNQQLAALRGGAPNAFVTDAR